MYIGEKWKGGRLMFQKGEYIVYGQHGICLVEDITHLNMSEADEKKLYYVLGQGEAESIIRRIVKIGMPDI